MEIAPQELYDIYMRMAEREENLPVPVSLAAIWETLSTSRYLRDLGCVFSSDPGRPTVTLFGIDGISDGTILSVSRELYEEGLVNGGRVHFASCGEPAFDAILAHMDQYELPGCIRCLAVRVPDQDGLQVVGLAVAAYGEGGLREVRLITTWNDLKGLHLAKDEILTTKEIEPLKAELRRMVDKEFELYRVVRRIERYNLNAARIQENLNLLVIQRLLDFKARYADEKATFWPVIGELESLFEERGEILVDLPADFLREKASQSLFEFQVPRVGDRASVHVSHILGRTAIDAAKRLAEISKARRSELYLNRVLRRLQAEVRQKRKQLGW